MIEADGGQHAYNTKDKERDTWLTSEGFKVLRFWNNEVLTNMEGVLEVIRGNCLSHPPLTPPLPSRSGSEFSRTDRRVASTREGETDGFPSFP